MRLGVCDKCKKEGATGWMSCKNMHLCAKCAAEELGMSEGEAKAALLCGFFFPQAESKSTMTVKVKGTIKKGGKDDCGSKSK